MSSQQFPSSCSNPGYLTACKRWMHFQRLCHQRIFARHSLDRTCDADAEDSSQRERDREREIWLIRYIYVYSYLFHRILCIMLCKGACARSSVFTYRGCPLPNPLQGIGAICYFNIQFEHTRIQIKAISSENCQSRILPYNTSVTVRLLNRTKTIHKCTIQCTITTTTANRSFLFIYLQCHHLYHH